MTHLGQHLRQKLRPAGQAPHEGQIPGSATTRPRKRFAALDTRPAAIRLRLTQEERAQSARVDRGSEPGGRLHRGQESLVPATDSQGLKLDAALLGAPYAAGVPNRP